MQRDTFDVPYREDTGRIPNPSHRHAAPSAPWPWVDLNDGISRNNLLSALLTHCLISLPLFSTEVDPEQLNSELHPIPALCDHRDCGHDCWKNYPQSRFPNWTRRQVKKSKILKAVEEYDRALPCKLYY